MCPLGFRFKLCAVLRLALFGLSACGRPSGAPHPLTCHTAYRSNVTVAIQREDTVNLSELAATPVTLNYADLTFHAQYFGEPPFAIPALDLFVTLPNQEGRLMSVLYQFPRATPANQFIDGHGFTGLHYVYHPISGAELQFWCVAD
ncbi:MAG: hypothetical protein MI924_21010 [Chloroflexales bacterium]|nr:hypothetical protein [Chloroflexales bacterium]